MESTDYVLFLLEASNDIQHQIDQSSTNSPSNKHRYSYKSKSGFVLETCSRSVSSDDYVTLSEVRSIVNGLLLYMMQGTRHRGGRFQVIQDQDATTAVIMNIGLVRQDMRSSHLQGKREFSPLHLIRFNSTSMSGSGNLSTPNLWTADNSDDFPIPDTHYSLRFGNTGPYLYLGDIETLLIAVHNEVERELITHGRMARLPSAEYQKDLVGLQLWIQAMPWDTDNLAWAELAIIVEGLWMYFVGGKHHRETFIDTINRDVGRQIAFGWIGKPHRHLEHSSEIAKVRRSLKALSPGRMS